MDRTNLMDSTHMAHESSRLVRYRLLDREGIAFGPYPTAQAAADMARELWPDEQQDEDRTGAGWDIEVVRT